MARRVSESGAKSGDADATGGKPEERSDAEESGYHGKCEIETAEAETINGDAVGADGVDGERAERLGGT